MITQLKEAMDNFESRMTEHNQERVKKARSSLEREVLLRNLELNILMCSNCGFRSTAQHPVPGRDNAYAELMLIGESPGEHEDLFGLSFCGIAGMLLTMSLEAANLTRGDVYLTNVLRCRPENNRTPSLTECGPCLGYLGREIRIIRPNAILLLGNVALECVLGLKGITKVRGEKHELSGIPVVPTWHPAYLVRQTGQDLMKAKQEFWSDLSLAIGLSRVKPESYIGGDTDR